MPDSTTAFLYVPLNAASELLRASGRAVFMHGLVTQGEHLATSYTGSILKK